MNENHSNMCDCAEGPTTVTDWSTGDVVCRVCGVVVEGHIIDDSPEWHVLDDARAGPPPNPFLSSDAVCGGTILSSSSSCKAAPKRRRLNDEVYQYQRPDPLVAGLAVVESCVAALGLATTGTVAGAAKQLFVDLYRARGGRADNRRSVAAAAVYFACKLERVERELRLVATACDVDTRALHAATREYKDGSLADKPYYRRLFEALPADRLIDVFLDRLRLSDVDRKRVWRAANRLHAVLEAVMDCGRKPRTICSGLLLLALQAEGVQGVGKKELTRACSVCHQTLDKVVAHIRSVLPDDDVPPEKKPLST